MKITKVYKKYVADLSSLEGYCKYQNTESCFGEVPRKQTFTLATSNKCPWKQKARWPCYKTENITCCCLRGPLRMANVISQPSLAY